MFEFFKPVQTVDDVEATGTFACAAMQIPAVELSANKRQNERASSHSRDYGSDRQVPGTVIGYA